MVVFPFRLAVLGKLNNFVKEWIAEISELKVGFGLNVTEAVPHFLLCLDEVSYCDLLICASFLPRTFHHQLLAALGARYLRLVHTVLECIQKVCGAFLYRYGAF